MKLTWGLSNDPLKRFRKGWPKTGVRRQEMSADPLGSWKGPAWGMGGQCRAWRRERPFTAVCGVERNRPAFSLARDGDGLSGQRTKSKRGSPEGEPFGAERVDRESRNTSPRPSPQSGEGGESPRSRRLARRSRGSSATREETRRTPPARSSVEQLASFLVGGFAVGEDFAAVATGGDFAIWRDQTFVGADAAPAQAGDVAGGGFEFERFNIGVVHGVEWLFDSA